MRHDPQIEVVCDTCGDSAFWEPTFGYDNIVSGAGSYDTSDRAFSAWCVTEGWTEDGDKTYCPDCSERRQ
ncbi:hypothetical protein HGG71_05835 [Rhodobacteraceae bacterium R_SAG2]|nr:hypothetical protein [Rhodobacteraceae bacterium R_SAG2]